MTEYQHQPKDPGARKGLLNEALLCDLIEGQLSDSKEESTREIIARDEVLASTIAQMEYDRAQLRSLGDEMCPSDMFNRLEPSLERELLLNASAHESGVMEQPVLRRSQPVVVKRASTWRIPALAFSAAAAILVVAGVVFFAQMLMARMPVNATRMAQNTPPAPAPHAPTPLADATANDDTGPLVVAIDEQATPQAIADLPPLIDRPQEAVRLARAGQLQMRVSANNADGPTGNPRVMLASMQASSTGLERGWAFDGAVDGGRIMAGSIICRFEPRASVLTDLTTALQSAGLRVTLEEVPTIEPEPLSAREIVWWKQRSTWEVQPARMPIVFDD